MNKETFIQGMEYLGAFYTNSKIDLDNKLVVSVWFNVFKDMEDQKFTNLVKSYCQESAFAPTSPTSLTNFMKDKMIEKRKGELSSEMAFEEALYQLRRFGYWIPDVIAHFKTSNNAISKTVEELVSSFATIQNDADQIPFVKNAFVKAYDRNLEVEVKQVVIGKTFKLLE